MWFLQTTETTGDYFWERGKVSSENMAQGQESEAEICSSKDNQERIMVKVNKQKDKRRVILFGIPLGT